MENEGIQRMLEEIAPIRKMMDVGKNTHTWRNGYQAALLDTLFGVCVKLIESIESEQNG